MNKVYAIFIIALIICIIYCTKLSCAFLVRSCDINQSHNTNKVVCDLIRNVIHNITLCSKAGWQSTNKFAPHANRY